MGSKEEVQEIFDHYKNTGGDISEHLETLKKYASECESIIELGVRYIVSTWSFILGQPKILYSIDLYPPSYYVSNGDTVLQLVYKYCKDLGIQFQFIQTNDLDISFDSVDMLFIDTEHTYTQLSAELNLHADHVKKYIIMHDTELFAEVCEYDGKEYGGMKRAMFEFLDKHPEWMLKEHYTNNNGLSILERIN